MPKEKLDHESVENKVNKQDKLLILHALPVLTAFINVMGFAFALVPTISVLKLNKDISDTEKKLQETRKKLAIFQTEAAKLDKVLSIESIFPVEIPDPIINLFEEPTKVVVDYKIDSYGTWIKKKIYLNQILLKREKILEKKLEKSEGRRNFLGLTNIPLFLLALQTYPIEQIPKMPFLDTATKAVLESTILPAAVTDKPGDWGSINSKIVEPLQNFTSPVEKGVQTFIADILHRFPGTGPKKGDKITALTKNPLELPANKIAELKSNEMVKVGHYFGWRKQVLTTDSDKLSFQDSGDLSANANIDKEVSEKLEFNLLTNKEMLNLAFFTNKGASKYQIQEVKVIQSLVPFISLSGSNYNSFKYFEGKESIPSQISISDQLVKFLDLDTLTMKDGEIQVFFKSPAHYEKYLKISKVKSEVVSIKAPRLEPRVGKLASGEGFAVIYNFEKGIERENSQIIIDGFPLENSFPNQLKLNADSIYASPGNRQMNYYNTNSILIFRTEQEAKEAAKVLTEASQKDKIVLIAFESEASKLAFVEYISLKEAQEKSGLDIFPTKDSSLEITSTSSEKIVIPMRQNANSPARVPGQEGNTVTFNTDKEVIFNSDFNALSSAYHQLLPKLLESEKTPKNLKLKIKQWTQELDTAWGHDEQNLKPANSKKIEQANQKIVLEIRDWIQQAKYGENKVLNNKLKSNPDAVSQILAILQAIDQKELITCHSSALALHALLTVVAIDSYVIGGYLNQKESNVIRGNEAHSFVVAKISIDGSEQKLMLVDSTPFLLNDIEQKPIKAEIITLQDVLESLSEICKDLQKNLETPMEILELLGSGVLASILVALSIHLKLLHLFEFPQLSEVEKRKLALNLRTIAKSSQILKSEDRNLLNKIMAKFLRKKSSPEKPELNNLQSEMEKGEQERETFEQAASLLICENVYWAASSGLKLFSDQDSFIANLEKKTQAYLQGKNTSSMLSDPNYQERILSKLEQIDFSGSQIEIWHQAVKVMSLIATQK